MPSALELFNDWISAREGDGHVEFAALLEAHPEIARELEELHALHGQLADAGEPSTPHRSVRAAVAGRLGDETFPSVSLHGERDVRSGTTGVAGRLAELASRGETFGRYEIEDEIARGGMGAILRVWDLELRRHLAMKVSLGARSIGRREAPRGASRLLARFLEEAQVTGQLDHPGIVPVHELGIDSDGRVYFTMKLVKGRDLREVFGLVFEGKEGWNETRALSTLLKVCEAMAYAHDKGVIHRDLKPANVMVGNFGEVFVMDWGLARVLGTKDRHDLRVRTDSREELADSPVVTMDGDVVGTPAYMPPEQARGEIEKLSPRADVYAIGAMLYHLLARRPPYGSRDARSPGREILARVVQGPPERLRDLRPDIPAELEAIVEKAMAREAESRYPDTMALAEDLRAFLEHRVVGAYEAGAWAEAKKWVQRNKPLAASLAAALALLVAGLTTSLIFKAHADERAGQLLEANTTIKERNQDLARTSAVATAKANDVLSLSAIQELKELEDESDTLWPAHAANLPKYERWLEQARVLVEGRAKDEGPGKGVHPSLSDHEAKLAEVRKRGRPRAGEGSSTKRGSGGDTHEPERAADERGTYDFDEAQDRWWHYQLAQLVSDLKAFTDPKSGGLYSSGVSAKHGWGIPRRAELARTIEERSVSSAEARRRWGEAIESVAKSALYGGLELTPQLDLLPIGEDPDSHLWEFAELQTGEPAERWSDGKLHPSEGSGLVLVLIPGGRFRMGAQATDPAGANFDSLAKADEAPVQEIELAPFFLSKFEMTQDQWTRFTGRNPSHYVPGSHFGDKVTTSLHPVEQVSWNDCAIVMERLALTLPTEAQWEFGARAGTSTAWWTGAEMESLREAANLQDAFCRLHGGPAAWTYDEWLDDGYTVHAPVGSYRANGFGLHDVVGNVWELCREGFARYSSPASAGDGERESAQPTSRMIRGGSFHSNAPEARSGARHDVTPEYRDFNIGLRPARALGRP